MSNTELPEIKIPAGPHQHQQIPTYFQAWAECLKEWAEETNRVIREKNSKNI